MNNRSNLFKKNVAVIFVLVSFLTFSQTEVDKEDNFYAAPTSYKVTKNLKEDYKVDNSFDTDDSEKLQRAIDEISSEGGGKLIIPEGNYSFVEVWFKSNVHIEVETGAIIRPTNNPKLRNHAMFHFSSEDKIPIKNVSVKGVNGRFTIDLKHSENKRVRVFNIRNVHNYLLSDFNIIDNYTLFASLEFLPLEDKTEKKLYSSRNGVIKNIEGQGIADYGYGLVQVRTGKNILFKNLGGIGGTTLRLEGHLKILRGLGGRDNMDNIVGRQIRCKKGNAALMLSPHYIHNGIVDIRNITAVGCGFAVRIETGFANKEEQELNLTPGYFSSESVVKDVKATYAKSEAQIKPKHYSYLPCDLRSLIEAESITPFPHGDSYEGPSIAAVIYKSNYKIDFEDKDVTFSKGFDENQIVVRAKDAKTCE